MSFLEEQINKFENNIKEEFNKIRNIHTILQDFKFSKILWNININFIDILDKCQINHNIYSGHTMYGNQ